MRRWIGIPLALLFVVGLLSSAWANSELHTAGRLFFPLWDVSTPQRLTFIIVTREALNDGASIVPTPKGTAITGVQTIITAFQISGTPGNCLPRGNNGSFTNVNRTGAFGGTSTTPVFVDDVHFEYYGKSCASTDEVVHMSCADIDLFLLAAANNPTLRPRFAFSGVEPDKRGALDVHFTTNGSNPGTVTDPKFRKEENSLMGHAIISDIAEGWAATYPAAAAKSTTCVVCASIDGGTQVGYENYPMEVFLPFALADDFPAPGGGLRNVLSLWGPGLLPGANLNNTTINIDFRWWDGRENPFSGSVNFHSLIRPLGGDGLPGLDPPLDQTGFRVSNFVCGLAGVGQAENDGFPRSGGGALCGPPGNPPLLGGDILHSSDNFQSTPDVTNSGHRIQSSTPIGWWRFTLRRDNLPPNPFTGNNAWQHSGRGLVGVVLTSTPGAASTGVGDATRLWHKDPCEVTQSSETLGPPHVRDREAHPDEISVFNIFSLFNQKQICLGFGAELP
jgi:hypothetical protein